VRRSLVILLIICLLVAVFAVQNSMMVKMKLWFWDAETYLGLVLIIFFASGALIGIAASLPAVIAKNREIKNLRKKLSSGKDNSEPVPDNESADPEFEDIDEKLN
jgi:uncharacterized integral membrane protein